MELVVGGSWAGRGARLLTGLMVATVLFAGVTATATGRAGCLPGQPTGAPGVGDTYYPDYGNGGYDVARYELDVEYNPATQLIERGEAAIEARATQSVCSFNLDLVGLEVQRINVDGRRASFSRTDHELTVVPRESLERGRRFEVVVRYAGEPTEFLIPGTTIRTGFMDTPDGATVAGQPEVAAGWFPVNDHPRDKAAYSFEVTVPAGYEVAANGFLRDVDTRRRWTTWEWEAREPMASYLATIDIGFWDVDEWRTEGGLPVYDAVDSALTGGLREEIDSSLSRQGEVLGLLEGTFGPYPFNTVGAIVDNQDDLRFALETQTRPVYSKLFWLDNQGNPENGDSVVVHELAHQWFGDDIAVHRWQDIWLNEGFATYAEWLWAEYEGQGTPQEIFAATYDAIPAEDEFWSVVVADPGVDLLFSDPIYVRGAMIVQALRNEVGDETFFEIVREWTAVKSGGTATTEEFIALAESIAGRDLNAEVFDPWLFEAGKPPFSEPEGDATATPFALGPAQSWHDDVTDRLARFGRY